MMAIRSLVRGLAYIALAGALLASAVALNSRRYPIPSASNGDPSANAGTLDSKLARCKALGAEGAQDAACKAVWEENRERFLGPQKPYQDRVTDAVPVTPDLKLPAPASGEGQPASGLQSPPTTDSDAPNGTAERSQ